MHEEEKAVVKRWLDYIRGDPDEARSGIDALMAPDVEWVVPGRSAMSGTYKGREAIYEDLSTMMWDTGDGRGGGVQGLNREVGFDLMVDEVVALEDGRILVRAHGKGVGNNGVPYDQEYCWIITVRDGKIAHLRDYCDTVMVEKAMFDKKLVPAEELQTT
jgi:ketosteroid isomerase-like protein